MVHLFHFEWDTDLHWFTLIFLSVEICVHLCPIFCFLLQNKRGKKPRLREGCHAERSEASLRTSPIAGVAVTGVPPLGFFISLRAIQNDRARSLHKCLNAGLSTAEDKGMDIVGALVGVHGFQVHHVANDVELVGDAVATVHVAGRPGNL